MSAPASRFDIVDERGTGDGLAATLHAVMRRIRPNVLLLALGAFALTHLMNSVLHVITRARYGVSPDHWKETPLIEALIVVSVGLALLVSDELVARGARRWTTYICTVSLACVFAAYVQLLLRAMLGWDKSQLGDLSAYVQPLQLFFDSWMYSTLAMFVYVSLRTARLAADRMRSAEMIRAHSRRRTFESRLQAMQARVEPQFLFNTLAQVRELYERDAVMADRMLDDLIAYLRAALPHLRESSSTLGREVELARAYLDIMRIRLGDKLAFEIDLPESAKSARIPPMMLLPLIDHALLHGLQPGHARGTIQIRTYVRDGLLHLAITDSGPAFLPGSNATEIENISQRLHALYGDKARFELERASERGTRARLEIPYENTDGSDR